MLHRREFLTQSLAAGFAAAATHAARGQGPVPTSPRPPKPVKSVVLQSVCRWCYGGIALDELCQAAASIGYASVELLGEKDWGMPRKYGLTCAMADGIGTIGEGWNRVENHERLVKDAQRLIPLVAEAGLPNLITFSGNRRGLADDEGMKNSIDGVKKIAGLAEKHKVTICIELLNSRVDHHDYQCDRTQWGVGVVKGVGSERVKLLYDIYHMQIMEGDVIRTIRDHIAYIGHFHTGGVPGRGEIDATQELNYRAICQAIAKTGFKGFIGQEFCPTRDPVSSLRQAFEICNLE